MKYKVANRETIANECERECLLMTMGARTPKRTIFQAFDVHKALLSISKVAGAGFECHLNEKVATCWTHTWVRRFRSRGEVARTCCKRTGYRRLLGRLDLAEQRTRTPARPPGMCVIDGATARCGGEGEQGAAAEQVAAQTHREKELWEQTGLGGGEGEQMHKRLPQDP